MLIIGTILAIAAFMLVDSLIGDCIMHNWQAGIIPGLVAAIWTFWPFFHWFKVNRNNLLHPTPKTYPVDCEEAFHTIIKILREDVYNCGDKWKITNADISSNHIAADLAFIGEELRLETTHRNGTSIEPVGVKRCISLQANIMPEDESSATIQLDFDDQNDGIHISATDFIASAFQQSLDDHLGTGEPTELPMAHTLPIPPWWIIATTILILLLPFKG